MLSQRILAVLSSLILVSVLLAAGAGLAPSPLAVANGPGDVNCSTSVDAIDAALVLQYTAGLISSLPCMGSGNVNADGVVDAVDAALILQYVAGLIPELLPPPM